MECKVKGFDLPHTFDHALTNESIIFVPGVSFSKTCATGLFVPSRLTKELLRLNKRMAALTPDPEYKPEVGDVVVAFEDKLDTTESFRAIVLRKPEPLFPQYSVFHLDLGTVVKYDTDSFARPPPDSLNFPGTATLCSVVDQYLESLVDGLDLNMKYSVKVDAIDQELGICKGSLIQSSKLFDVVFEKGRPRQGDLLDYVPLKTGDRVSILPFEKSNKIYIRPKDFDNVAQRFEILDLVNLNASEIPLEKDPLPHDLVAVSYCNSLWRAEVLRKVDDHFDVVLIDKGHHMYVERDEMRSLPEDLTTLPRCAVPVKLRGVRTIEVDRKNLEFMKFMEKEFNFELVIEEDSTVTLKFLKGVVYGIEKNFRTANKFATANEYIEDSLLPFWLGCLRMDSYYYPDICSAQDLKYWPQDWQVGKTYSLLVAAVGDESTISVCNKNGMSHEIFLDMDVENRLQEYGKHITDPYRCKLEEVCVAKSRRGVWERAQCLMIEAGSPPIMFFLDTGTIEPVFHTDIRRCEKEFLGYPPIADLLTLTNAKTVNVNELLNDVYEFKIVSENEIELVEELDSE